MPATRNSAGSFAWLCTPGAAIGELGTLKVADFDHENETLVIHQSKSGRPRYVYLTGEGAANSSNRLPSASPRDMVLIRGAPG